MPVPSVFLLQRGSATAKLTSHRGRDVANRRHLTRPSEGHISTSATPGIHYSEKGRNRTHRRSRKGAVCRDKMIWTFLEHFIVDLRRDCDRLPPTDEGFRSDVLEPWPSGAHRRWPGGACLRLSLQDRVKTGPLPSTRPGGWRTTVSTDEFIRLCRKLDCGPTSANAIRARPRNERLGGVLQPAF